MGIACKINRINGKVESVTTQKGTDSILFKDALSLVKNNEKALDVYTVMHTQDFQDNVLKPSIIRHKNKVLKAIDNIPSVSNLDVVYKGKEYSLDLTNIEEIPDRDTYTGATSMTYRYKLPEGEVIPLGSIVFTELPEGYQINLSEINDNELKVYEGGKLESVKGRGLGTVIYKKLAKTLIKGNEALYADFSHTLEANGVWKKFQEAGVITESVLEDAQGNPQTVYTIKPTPNTIDKNGEPVLSEVTNYLGERLRAGKTLSSKQARDIRNALLTNPNLKEKITKAFLTQGLFTINRQKLLSSGLYMSPEVENIMGDKDLQQEIKDTVEAYLNSYDESLEPQPQYQVTEEAPVPAPKNIIKPIINWLKNTELAQKVSILPEQGIIEKLRFKDPSEVNSLGLYRNNNPYIAEKELTNLLGGVKDRDQFEAILDESEYEGFKQEYYSDKEFADEFYNEMQTLNRLREFKTRDGELIRKTKSETEELFEETLLVADNGLDSEIDYLNTIPQDIWDNNPSEVTDLLESVREKAVDYGVNLNEIEAHYLEKTQKEILDLLNSLKNVNLQPNRENVKTFAKVYEDFYQLDKEGSVRVRPVPVGHKDKTLLSVDTNLSEYELFENYGLLRLQGDIYQKVNNTNNLDTLYALITEAAKMNPNILPLEAFKSFKDKKGILNRGKLKQPEFHDTLLKDIQKFAQEKVSLLEIPDFNVSSETLQKMVLYKFYFNLDFGFQTPVNEAQQLNKYTNFDGVAGYLKTGFIADFNKESIKQQQKDSQAYRDFYSNFEVSNKGITMINSDPITMAIIKDYLQGTELKNSIRRNLLQYSIVSKNLNLNELLEDNSKAIKTNEFYRDFYTNNPEQAPKAEGQYTIINENTIAATGNPRFIRTPKGIFEAVAEEGNVSFYSLLPKADSNYNHLSVEKPGLGVDTSKYSHLKSVPKLNIVAKKYYSGQELERINEEHFNCA